MFVQLKKYQFLLEELVKRDFKKKYKRTVLGMGWSMLMPLLMLLAMKVVFGQFFGRSVDHYTIYIFCGILIFNWFSEATNNGMLSLYGNSHIFTKVNVPKYLFLLSGIVQTFINFVLSLIVFFFFCWLDNVPFTWKFVMLLYPVMTMLLFCMGMGMLLSALFIFFRDIDYLWRVFLQLLVYGSAIFYTTDRFSPELKLAFSLNPLYRYITYFREIVLAGRIPSLETHLTLLGFALAVLLLGMYMYKTYNTKFLYYV